MSKPGSLSKEQLNISGSKENEVQVMIPISDNITKEDSNIIKRIDKVICSPNMKYVVTWSKVDNLVCGWPVDKDSGQLNFDSMINIDINELIDVSDQKDIIILDIENVHRIVDATTKLRYKLNFEGNIDKIAFFENDVLLKNNYLAVVSSDPDYRVNIFSRTNSKYKYEWIFKRNIVLTKYYRCNLTPKGKLLILRELPFTILQWDLRNLELEAEYILDWNLYKYKDNENFHFLLSSNNKLLAVIGDARYAEHSDESKPELVTRWVEKTTIYIYSKESSKMLVKYAFDGDNLFKINSLHFIKLNRGDRLLFKTDGPKYRMMNPRTLVNVIDAEMLLLSIVSNNQLWIQNLVKNENHIDEFKVNSLVNVYSCGEEINQIIRDANFTLEKKYVGSLFTWIVKVINKKDILLTAWKYDHEMLVWIKIGDTIQIINNHNIKFKLLESEDTIQIIDNNNSVKFKLLGSEDLISILFGGIYIWTASTGKGIHLLHYWNEFELYDLESYNSHFLKSPRFGQILEKMNETNDIMYKNIRTNECFKYEDLLECFVEDLQVIKLYGNDLMKGLIEYGKNTYCIKKLFTFCLEQSLLQLKHGYISTFIELIDIITSSLLELEEIDKSFDFTERFLSKTALLISDDFKEDFLEKNSLTSQFKDCGTYDIYLRIRPKHIDKIINIYKNYSIKTKIAIYCFFLFIFDIFLASQGYFDISSSSLDSIITLLFIFLNVLITVFWAYFTFDWKKLHYKQTVKLIIPLSPFDLSYLNASRNYRWWNINALINFEWETFGDFYYLWWLLYIVFLFFFAILTSELQNETYLESGDLPILLGMIGISYGGTIISFEIYQFFSNKIKYIKIHGNVVRNVLSITLVLIIIIIAFAHALYILLKPNSEYSYDYPSYTSDPNNPWNLVTRYQSVLHNAIIETNSSLIETPDENTNLFANFGTALLAVYYMLLGDTSSISPWILKENLLLDFLFILFSFFTTIYLMNLFIGFLTSAMENVHEESYLQFKGEALAEMKLLRKFMKSPRKLLRMTKYQDELTINRKILYYEASVDELKKYVKKIKDNDNEESVPYLSNAILEIAEYKNYEIEDKIEIINNKVNKIIESIELNKKD
ncbi:hypothetical protein F8M41_025996 [Gigaspora margarita]|uniref:Ion transport domain-containing protein n=1 Tax=Gigaspora margarita TaxID=4874 RepID=A0A8H3XIB3_GIGMA|nr:hypothetical protein F8M41_025996 [Gigaspora margarita]